MSILTNQFLAENLGMIDDQKRRVEKLKALKGDLSIAAFCRQYNKVDPTYVSQLLNGHRSFGEKAARTMEEKLNLQSGWFDLDEGSAAGPWPFTSISYDEYMLLDEFDKREIESALAMKAERIRHNKSVAKTGTDDPSGKDEPGSKDHPLWGSW